MLEVCDSLHNKRYMSQARRDVQSAFYPAHKPFKMPEINDR